MRPERSPPGLKRDSTGDSSFRDEMEIAQSRIQNEACSCLFIHQGRVGKTPGQVTELWGQEAFHVQERGCVTPVLSSYLVMYPEKTMPIELITPIPLVKWTEFS